MLDAASCRAYTVLLLTDASAHSVCVFTKSTSAAALAGNVTHLIQFSQVQLLKSIPQSTNAAYEAVQQLAQIWPNLCCRAADL